jgi:hypothetical protein
LPEAALARLQPQYSSSDPSKEPAYSKVKGVYKCICSNSKHMCLAANDTVARKSLGALRCRICERRGSSYEKEAYRLLNCLKGVKAFAAEAHAVRGKVQYKGVWVDLSKHRWDLMLLNPARVLVAVQGEQHHSKLDTRRNSSRRSEADLADSMVRDMALAAAARQQHFQVVWLMPGREAGRTQRWRAAMERAMAATAAKEKPQLHIG